MSGSESGATEGKLWGFNLRQQNKRESQAMKGRSRVDPLPMELWSPRLTIDQSLGDFVRRTCELTICIGSPQEAIYNLTCYEGTIKNIQDIHIAPLDTDTVLINFRTSEEERVGECVNYKTDCRLLFDGWMVESWPTVAPYPWQLVSTVGEGGLPGHHPDQAQHETTDQLLLLQGGCET